MPRAFIAAHAAYGERCAGLSILARTVLALDRAGVREISVDPDLARLVAEDPDVRRASCVVSTTPIDRSEPYISISRPVVMDVAMARQLVEAAPGARAGGVEVVAAGAPAHELTPQGVLRDAATPSERAEATRALFNNLRKKADGFISRHLNRHLSLALSRLLISTGVTPNQITIVCNVIGALGVWLVFRSTWLTLALGAALVQVQSIVDGCDGEIARLTYRSSDFGAWLDNVLDDIVNIAYGVGLGVAAANLLGEPLYSWFGVVAAIGFTFHNAVVYTQLIVVHKTGNPFAFRWWFQRGEGDLHDALSRPTLGARLGMVSRSLARRDVFLFAFMLLCWVRLPHIAVLWYAILGVLHLGMTAAHLALGGFAAARSAQPGGSSQP